MYSTNKNYGVFYGCVYSFFSSNVQVFFFLFFLSTQRISNQSQINKKWKSIEKKNTFYLFLFILNQPSFYVWILIMTFQWFAFCLQMIWPFYILYMCDTSIKRETWTMNRTKSFEQWWGRWKTCWERTCKCECKCARVRLYW